MNSRPRIQPQPAACPDDALAGLRAILRVTRPDADVELIRRAYDVAAYWHWGQARRSGDPYITHPLAVATILADSRVLAIKVADRLHNMRTVQFIAHAKQVRKARESLDIFAPVASQLSMDMIEAELETLAYATMKRNRHARSVSGRFLIAITALLPVATRIRWCEEWLGELHTLPARRDRASFAMHAVLGIPRLAFTVRKPAPGHGRAG